MNKPRGDLNEGVMKLAHRMRRLDVMDEMDVLITCKGYSPIDARKSAEERVQPLASYLKRLGLNEDGE